MLGAREATMDAFQGLLQPIGIDRFLSEHWARRAVHITGNPTRFDHLPGMEELPAMLGGKLSPEKWEYEQPFMQAMFVDPQGNSQHLMPVPPHMLPQLYSAGMSLCFPPVHTLSPK